MHLLEEALVVAISYVLICARVWCFAIKKIPVQMFDSTEIETWDSVSGLYGAVKYQQAVIIFMDHMIACEEAEKYPDDDNSLSSYMSGATESLGLSVNPSSSSSAAGQWTNELGNVIHDDGRNDDNNNVDDDYDDDDDDDNGGSGSGDNDDDGEDNDNDSSIGELDVHGAEAAIWNFGEGPWQGLLDHGKNKATKLSLLIYHAFSVMLLQQDLFSLFGMYFSATPLCVGGGGV
ncbi:hypothetical protein OS493_016069 [Desmophyllum pertusum]|uniref:Uncharacterized protein n=1 Tax=Desmophyllum pertusum TaxID=174260 RepID=A0A9X0D900_9CNID|nr:hypothetical protein OS493_016069 [Desmophyllum pertusum]